MHFFGIAGCGSVSRHWKVFPIPTRNTLEPSQETTVGWRLSTFRRGQGLTQLELAEKLGIEQRKVSRLEKNQGKFDHVTVKKLRTEFGLNSDWLLYGTGNPGTIAESNGKNDETAQTSEIERLKEKIKDQEKIIAAQEAALEIARTAINSLTKNG